MLGWMLPWFSTRMPPMQPLKHVCWTVLGCQEGATFYISCATSPPILSFFSCLFFLSFFLFKGKQSKCRPESNVMCVYNSPHFLSLRSSVIPLPPSFLLYFLSLFAYCMITHIKIEIQHICTWPHTFIHIYISYPPVVNKLLAHAETFLFSSIASCENVLLYAGL